MQEDRLLKQPDALDIIGMSRSWLEKDRLKQQPTIPFVKVGKSVRYRLSNLRAFVRGE